MDRARSVRRTTKDARGYSSLPRWNACAHPDDGECSEWFGVGQGLWQGCVLALLLFNIFFTAVLRVAVERFSANAHVVKDTVYSKVKDEEGGGRSEGGRKRGEINPRRLWRNHNRSGECCMQTTRASFPNRGTALRR